MPAAADVLSLLAARRNAILSGPPGTGKSLLLAEVARLFEAAAAGGPAQFEARPGIPARPRPAVPAGLPPAMAVPNRRVFRAVMHQSSKHRDFLTGVMPDLRPGQPPGQFRIVEGILYRASEYAKQGGHAALVIIDEINRGPAVQVFGGAIVAMEGEKRLAENGQRSPSTQFFDLLDPGTGEIVEYAFPPRLFILAAMNQADVSVEPLDVAFLRRWAPLSLEPDAAILRAHFQLPAAPQELPVDPAQPADVFEALVQAFEAVNERIALGRGPEFRIGHGVVMVPQAREPGAAPDAPDVLPADMNGAMAHAAIAWSLVRNHIEEAFFGDVRGTATVLNAAQGIAGHPLDLKDMTFGEAPRSVLTGPKTTSPVEVYAMLKAVATKPAVA